MRKSDKSIYAPVEHQTQNFSLILFRATVFVRLSISHYDLLCISNELKPDNQAFRTAAET